MAKYNRTQKDTPKGDETINYEGAPAFKLGDKLELFTLVATSMMSNKYYASENEETNRLISLIKKNNPEYVAKLAVYARNDLYLRSVSTALVGELFKLRDQLTVEQRRLLRKATSGICQRVDDMTELAAYMGNLKNLPRQLLNGLEDVFREGRFDEYQFAKYDRKDKGVRPRDLMRLVHPRPVDKKQEDLFKKLKDESLDTPYTWETQLSERGNTKAVWEELIDSGRLGIMALVRNLRNILKAKVSDEHIKKVCAILSDEATIKKSKMFPFRFYAAWLMLGQTETSNHAYYRNNRQQLLYNVLTQRGSKKEPELDLQLDPFVVKEIKKALSTAIGHTVDAVVEEVVGDKAGRVMITTDVSGSMEAQVSAKSVIERKDIALLLGGLLQNRTSNGILSVFGQGFSLINSEKVDVLDLPDNYPDVGHSTNGYLVIDYLNKNKIHVDKIFMFTDCQLWNDNTGNYRGYADGGNINIQMNKYWSQVNPKAKLFLIDLAGYGTSPVRILENKRVYLVSGWSEAVFRMLNLVENGESMPEYIEKLDIDYWRKKKNRKEEEE